MANDTEMDMRTFVRTYGPIAAFYSCTALGILFIIVSKLLGIAVWLTILVPIFVMVGYAVANLTLQGLRLHNEQAGDNLYYMGFLYTLTSLAVSLYLFTTNDGGQSSIDQVVNNFGIAVSSTIVGIAARIGFNQSRRDPLNYELTVRAELGEMSKRVRAEMDNSALEFSSYRRASAQMLNEGFEEIARQAEKNGEAVRVAIESMSQSATASIATASGRIAASLEEIAGMLAKFSEKGEKTLSDAAASISKTVMSLEDRAKHLGDAIAATAARYEAARTPDEVFKIEVTAMTEDLRKLNAAYTTTSGEQLKKMTAHIEKLDAALEPLAEASRSAPEISERLGRNTQVGETLNVELASVSKALSEAVAEQGLSRAATARSVEGMSDIIRAVETLSQRVAGAIEGLSQAALASSTQHTDMAAAVASIGAAKEDADRNSGQLSAALGTLSGKIDGLIAATAAENDQPRRGWWGR